MAPLLALPPPPSPCLLCYSLKAISFSRRSIESPSTLPPHRGTSTLLLRQPSPGFKASSCATKLSLTTRTADTPSANCILAWPAHYSLLDATPRSKRPQPSVTNAVSAPSSKNRISGSASSLSAGGVRAPVLSPTAIQGTSQYGSTTTKPTLPKSNPPCWKLTALLSRTSTKPATQV